MPEEEKYVLLSWVARQNDPYRRKYRSDEFELGSDGKLITGPTLSLLFDEASPYRGKVTDVVLLGRVPRSGPKEEKEHEKAILQETVDAIDEKDPRINVELGYWIADDPTDHPAIFGFLRDQLPRIRARYRGRHLLVHVSPGTPSMQTVWVVLGEMGLIDKPFTLVKSVEARHRRKPGDEAVVPVELGIETPFKAYKESRPRMETTEDEELLWRRDRFKSPRLVEVWRKAESYAKLKIPILILGERGTGKTTLASWIRSNSPFRDPKKDKSWPNVPCGQYAQETVRGELFGYKKGSFTGALKDYAGQLAEADGDTLFLDEIGDISQDVQRLLIKAIESGEYQQIGNPKSSKSDFRLITATNLDLATLFERLDRDFVDRISHLTLALPALREIPEDLDWLWEEIFERAMTRAAVDDDHVRLTSAESERVINRLRKEQLRGNLRDLFRVAYHIIASLSAIEGSKGRTKAIDEAITSALESLRELPSDGDDPTRAVVSAFINGGSLEAAVDKHEIIPSKKVDKDLHRFIATEAKRIGRIRKVRAEELVDVAQRTLDNWGRAK